MISITMTTRLKRLSMPINVDIQLVTEATQLPDVAMLKYWAEQAVMAEQQEGELTVRIVGAKEMQTLNETFRQQPTPTNVLSFPFLPPPGVELPEPCLGDVIICHEVIQQEASAQHKSLDAHYAHMVVHGILHLLGYDHINTADAEKMEALEVAQLARFGFANPYNGEQK